MRVRAVLLIIVLAVLSLGFFEPEYEEIFVPVNIPPPSSEDPSVVRSRIVKVRDFVPLGSDAYQGASGITFNFFDDFRVQAVKERLEWRGEDRYSWLGQALGSVTYSHIILTREANTFGGHFQIDGRHFQLSPLGDGNYLIQEIQPAIRFHDGVIRAPKGPARMRPKAAPPDDGSVIDAMIAYTESAGASRSNIVNTAQQVIDQMNLAFTVSGIGSRVRLVRLVKTDYSEVGNDLQTDLNRLYFPNDGYMDDLHAEREKYGADFVILMINGNRSNVLGLAFLSDTSADGSAAFGVVQTYLMETLHVFAHEAGHILGSHHDRATTTDPGAFTYSHGYYDNVADFGTIMSYNGTTKIGYYSNPNVNYNGRPTGVLHTDPNSADNARSINNMVPVVASFKTSVVPESQSNEVVAAGCFIATAAYGSSLQPKVMMLRRFRDRVLNQSVIGRWLVKTYYSISPAIAQFIEDNPGLKPVVRASLLPVIGLVESLYGARLQ